MAWKNRFYPLSETYIEEHHVPLKPHSVSVRAGKMTQIEYLCLQTLILMSTVLIVVKSQQMNRHASYLFERNDFSSPSQFVLLMLVSQSHSQPTRELCGQQPLILVLWSGDCCTGSLKHTRCKQSRCGNISFPRNWSKCFHQHSQFHWRASSEVSRKTNPTQIKL